jgi:hypothetical protein
MLRTLSLPKRLRLQGESGAASRHETGLNGALGITRPTFQRCTTEHAEYTEISVMNSPPEPTNVPTVFGALSIDYFMISKVFILCVQSFCG